MRFSAQSAISGPFRFVDTVDAHGTRKIRMRLGGNGDIFDAFPDKPKGMHWRTYDRLRSAHDVAAERLTGGLMRVDRLRRRSSA
jgi:hypothetical protein